jgi:hypothetical protein
MLAPMDADATTEAPATDPPERWRIPAWVALLTALTALHVGMLSARPLHINTLYTGGKMLLGWGALWSDLQTNAFPPLYYLIARSWASLAGVEPWALLLPSLLVTLASAPALAWAIRPWVPDTRVRLCAGALAGLHSFAVLFGSGFAKAYAPMWLAMILGVGAYIRCAEAALTRSGGSRADFAGFAGASVVASQLHFPGIALPLLALVHAGLIRGRLEVGSELLRRVAAVAGASLALYALWIGRISTRLVEGAGMAWHPPKTLDRLGVRLLGDWQWLWSGSIHPSALSADAPERVAGQVGLGIGIAMLGFFAVALLRRPRDPRAAASLWLLALWILVPLLAVAILDRFRPIYHVRYVGTVLFPAAVLGAVCVGALLQRRRRALAALVLTLLLAGRAAGIESLGTLPILQDWLGIYRAALVQAREENASLVLIGGADWMPIMMRYIEHVDGPTPDDLRVFWLNDTTDPNRPGARALLADHERVLVAGVRRPPRIFERAGDSWRQTRFDGYWRRYTLLSGRREKYRNFLVFERDARR